MKTTTTTSRPAFGDIVSFVAGLFRILPEDVTAKFASGAARHAKRQLCYLASVNGFGQAEIASIIGVSRQSVCSMIATFTRHLSEARLAQVEARFTEHLERTNEAPNSHA